ncbi:hypothetical protein ALMP_23510 [Streptomyces sp. A012304]|nr:hypothetical protein ALMP_23510 [Streptomyces sp. A012304]
MGRHAVGVAERAQQRERAGPQAGGQLFQRRRIGHPLLQHGTRACGDACSGGPYRPLRQGPTVESQQSGHGDPQQCVGGERVALVRGPQHPMHEGDGVRVVEHGADEARRATDERGLGRYLGHELG